jgi:hypothetical protein
MNKDFSHNSEGAFIAIKKHTYPRFKAIFDYTKPLPEFMSIQFSDECTTSEKVKSMSQLDSYMKSIRKEIRK